MALSGSFTGSTSNGYIVPKIIWSATQSVSGNYSMVTAELRYSRTNSETTYGGWVGSITINGTEITLEDVAGSTSKYIKITKDSNTLAMKTDAVKVPHNSDGTKSITISATGYIGGTTLKSTSISKTIALDTIPRASSITSAGAVTLGNKCSIKWTPMASSFAYKVKLSCGGVTHTSGYLTPGNTSEYTYSATMSISYWASAMPTSYSGTCTATLYTYTSSSSTSAIGSDSITFTLTLPNNFDTCPVSTLKSPELIDGWNGYYIQGKSRCKLSATFAAGPGSTIKSCSLSGTGISLSGSGTSLSGTTSILSKAGKFTYTAKMTDGRSTSVASTQITVYAYANPTLSISAARMSNGSDVKITYKASCSSVNSKNNLVNLKIYRKLSTDDIWPSSPTRTITLSSTSTNGTTTLSNYDSTLSYDFKAVVTDTYGSSSVEAIASVTSEFRIVNISADKQRLSIGKMASGEINTRLFDCAFPARFLDGVEFTNNNESVYGSLEVDYNENGNNIVYIRNGQYVDGGDRMGLAIHSASVYIPGEANDGLVNLGSGSRKWNQLYASNGTISTSDRKVKTDITDMSNTQEQLFNKLRPVTYKFVNGNSNRTHYGFVSQDVEEALNELQLTGQDFAGFCKDVRVDEYGAILPDEDGKQTYDYSLRYSEFIALNTYMIQKLQAENAELKAELQELKELIVGTSSNNVE